MDSIKIVHLNLRNKGFFDSYRKYNVCLLNEFGSLKDEFENGYQVFSNKFQLYNTAIVVDTQSFIRLSYLSIQEVIKIIQQNSTCFIDSTEKNDLVEFAKMYKHRFCFIKLFTRDRMIFVGTFYMFCNVKHRLLIPKLYKVVTVICKVFSDRYKIILSSDVNSYSDRYRDNVNNKKHLFSKHYLEFLKENNYLVDSFRDMYPDKIEFTFRNQSRIDVIFVQDCFKNLLNACSIDSELQLIENTDHSGVIIQYNIRVQSKKITKPVFDNVLLELNLPIMKKIQPMKFIDKDKYNDATEETCKDELKNKNLSDMTIDEKITVLYQVISLSTNIEGIEKEVGDKDSRLSNEIVELNNKLQKKDELYKEINELKNLKNKALKTRRRTRNVITRERIEEQIKKCNKEIDVKIKQFKHISYSSLIAKEIYKDPSFVYKLINNSTGSLDFKVIKDIKKVNREDSLIDRVCIERINEKNEIELDLSFEKQVIDKEIVDYYTNLFKDEHEIDKSIILNTRRWKKIKQFTDQKYEIQFNENEVFEIIRDKIQKDKSSDLYGVEIEHFQFMSSSCIKLLTHIINDMFNTDFLKSDKYIIDVMNDEDEDEDERVLTFGKIFHQSSYMTLLKKIQTNSSESFMIKNQRPITVISLISKVFSSCVLQRLESYVNDEDILDKNQIGFRQKYSTLNHLVTLNCYRDIMNFYNKGKFFCAFIDFKKAYDNVNHKVIKKIFKYIKLPRKIRNSILNSLKNNSVIVKTAQGFTGRIQIEKGVKQGDPMSPLIFNIVIEYISCFMNQVSEKKIEHFDFFKFFKQDIKLNHLLYADDVVLISHDEDQFRRTIFRFKVLSEMIGFQVNENKSFFVNTYGIKELERVKIPGFTIHHAIDNTYKYLGVMFDASCLINSTIEHQIYIKDKIDAKLKKIESILNLIPPLLLIRVINSTIIPLLTYGSLVIYYKPQFIRKMQSTINQLVRRSFKWSSRSIPDSAINSPTFLGGLGLANIEHSIKVEQLTQFHTIMNHYKDSYSFKLMNLLLLHHQVIYSYEFCLNRYNEESRQNCWLWLNMNIDNLMKDYHSSSGQFLRQSRWLYHIVKTMNEYGIKIYTTEDMHNFINIKEVECIQSRGFHKEHKKFRNEFYLEIKHKFENKNPPSLSQYKKLLHSDRYSLRKSAWRQIARRLKSNIYIFEKADEYSSCCDLVYTDKELEDMKDRFKLLEKNVITVFTDGSLFVEKEDIQDKLNVQRFDFDRGKREAGYAIVPVDNITLELIDEVLIEAFPLNAELLNEMSSFHCELYAIYRTVELTPRKSILVIYTDSLSCILILKPFIMRPDMIVDLIRLRKRTARYLIYKVVELIREKDIDLVLFHIRSHQDKNTMNDIADEYAKKAAKNKELDGNVLHGKIHLDYKERNVFVPDRFTFLDNDFKIIDYDIRKFLKFRMFEKLNNKWLYEKDVLDYELHLHAKRYRLLNTTETPFNKKMQLFASLGKRSNSI